MKRVKLMFQIEQDDDGYPPISVESVWAKPTGSGTYLVDNIPFFATDAALGDEVNAKDIDGDLFYVSMKKPSGNSLLRVVFFDSKASDDLIEQLARLECDTERSHVDCLVAINVPPPVKLRKVQQLLNTGCERQHWDYEEPLLRQ